jgi:hypothetical protein
MAEQRANMAIASTPEESYDSEDITEETITENYASMLFALHSLTRGTFLDSGSSADSLPDLVDDDDDDSLPSLIDESPNKKQRLVSPETVPSVNDIFVSESISKKIRFQTRHLKFLHTRQILLRFQIQSATFQKLTPSLLIIKLENILKNMIQPQFKRWIILLNFT